MAEHSLLYWNVLVKDVKKIKLEADLSLIMGVVDLFPIKISKFKKLKNNYLKEPFLDHSLFLPEEIPTLDYAHPEILFKFKAFSFQLKRKDSLPINPNFIPLSSKHFKLREKRENSMN